MWCLIVSIPDLCPISYLATPNDAQSVAYYSYNIQATSKGSDQNMHMRYMLVAHATLLENSCRRSFDTFISQHRPYHLSEFIDSKLNNNNNYIHIFDTLCVLL